jgi:hypothetical protein
MIGWRANPCGGSVRISPATENRGGQAMEYEGYCVKCREKRTIKDGKVEKTAKGRPIAKGKCPECGTTVTRFLSSKDVA